MIKIKNIALITSSFILLSGCGGGSGGSTSTSTTTTTSTNTSTLSGTVPGTLIEAFCKDGSYYRVNSTKNGTTKHPFSLTIPKGLDCKLVMTTNENDSNISNRIVTPINLTGGGLSSSYFTLSSDTSIGNIPLATTGTGIQNLMSIDISNSSLEIREFSYDPLDIDGDGIPNVYEDNDGNGIYNKDDKNDPNNKFDTDGDGIPNSQDIDIDGDGLINSIDNDDDGDGKKDSEDDDKNGDGVIDSVINKYQTTTTSLVTSFNANDGRLLGSNCAQCHGTDGTSVNSWNSIAGKNNLNSEFYEDENVLMSAVAHGFTTNEVISIGSWLSNVSSNGNSDSENKNDGDNDND